METLKHIREYEGLAKEVDDKSSCMYSNNNSIDMDMTTRDGWDSEDYVQMSYQEFQ